MPGDRAVLQRGICGRWGVCSCRQWRGVRPRAWLGLGRVALGGTKVGANAAKRKAMSYARMSGLDQARGEWLLLATCHHLRKLHSQIGVAKVAGHPASR